jgi:hypothetical protein
MDMTYNEAITKLTAYGVQPRTALNAVRKSSIQAQTVAPFGHTVNRPRQIVVDTRNFEYMVTPVW